MFVGVVGLNYDTAPLKLRENLSFGTNELLPALEELTKMDGIEEGVLLTTCNRTEFYFRGDQQEAEETVLNWFSTQGGLEVANLKKHFYCYRNLEGAEHLFKVITGLDSMVLGEVEVAGQVKEAYELSRKEEVTGKYLNYLFQKSFEVNKEVRNELDLDGLPLSLSHVAVDKLEELFGGLEGTRGMVIGVGEVGELALKYLIEHGIDGVWVANRTRERSEEVTDDIGGTPVTFEERDKYVPEVEIIISATGCPATLIGPSDIPKNRTDDLFLVDLAVPRDFDPKIGEIEGCHLYDVDDLKDLAGKNKRRRGSESRKVSPTINRHVEEFGEWLNVQKVADVIASLNKKANRIKRRELKELNGEKLNRKEVERISGRILNNFLHEPIIELKEAAKNGEESSSLADSVVRLFNL